MAECIKCGKYTKYNGGLCINCFREQNQNKPKPENAESQKTGLTEYDKNYRYSMIKGRIAETLIQELFLSLGFNVFRYGMENTIPGIMDLLKGVRSDVAQEIRRMPDFVIQNTESKDVFFIEVKFRANGEFKTSDLPKDYPFTNAYIILVSKRHIKCLTVKELFDGQEITPDSKNYLANRPEFHMDRETVIAFCNFAIQIFESV